MQNSWYMIYSCISRKDLKWAGRSCNLPHLVSSGDFVKSIDMNLGELHLESQLLIGEQKAI